MASQSNAYLQLNCGGSAAAPNARVARARFLVMAIIFVATVFGHAKEKKFSSSDVIDMPFQIPIYSRPGLTP